MEKIQFAVTRNREYYINKIWEVFTINKFSKKESKRKESKNIWWYSTIQILKKEYKIHRLVAQAFIPNPENKPQVNHKNWIKNDNRVDNLEWVTANENMNHAYNLWLKKISDNNNFIKNPIWKWKFWKEHNRSKPLAQYTLDWALLKEYVSWKEAQDMTWVNKCHICSCAKWKKKTAGWFIWKFL